jgi:hypothetical protein
MWKGGKTMVPKIKISMVFNILAMGLTMAGAALSQYTAMKEWKDEMTEKAENEAKQLTDSDN